MWRHRSNGVLQPLLLCLPPTLGWCCGCSDVSTRPLRSVSCSSFLPRSRPNPQGPQSEGRTAPPVPERAEAQCGGPDPSPPGLGSHLPVGTLQSMGSELPLHLQADSGRKLWESSLLFRCKSHLLVLKDPSHLPLVGGRGCGRHFPLRMSFLRNVEVIKRAEM